jgi:hypothetical protein
MTGDAESDKKIEWIVLGCVLVVVYGIGLGFLWIYPCVPKLDPLTDPIVTKFWVENLQKTVAHYNENNYQTIGLLLVAMGWIITSTQARDFLRAVPRVKWVLVGVIASFLILHAWIIRSLSIAMARALSHIPESYAADSPSLPSSWSYDGTAHLLLFVLACVVVQWATDSRLSEKDKPKGRTS